MLKLFKNYVTENELNFWNELEEIEMWQKKQYLVGSIALLTMASVYILLPIFKF